MGLKEYTNNVLFSTKLCGVALNDTFLKKNVEAELEKNFFFYKELGKN